MLDPESKFLMLSIESDMQKDDELQQSARPTNILDLILGTHNISPYCIIEVRRSNLIEDALNVLAQKDMNFNKELKVRFVGEQGEDAGGVKKEFFQLIIRELFDPAYSMFIYNSETRTYWFNSNTLEMRIKFELVGFIIGLAMYNMVNLDVHFPRVIYKKLLNLTPSFEVP